MGIGGILIHHKNDHPTLTNQTKDTTILVQFCTKISNSQGPTSPRAVGGVAPKSQCFRSGETLKVGVPSVGLDRVMLCQVRAFP